MDGLVFHIDERLAEAGDCITLADHIDRESYTVGGREFALPEGLDYDLTLTNADEGILVSGILRAHVGAACDRCLDPADFDIAGEVGEYYLFEEPEYADEDDETEYLLVSPTGDIDLGEALDAVLAMETPFVVLCREDCRGLCPRCGANLNEGDCGCADRDEERRMEESPFAALKNLM